MVKTLDTKIAAIRTNPAGAKDFILADAKDADMAFGLASAGPDPATGRMRSLADYRDQIREIVRQGLVDIMLMSCSTSDQLAIRERLFENSHVTPAARANDTTDIHVLTGATYTAEPSRPFRTATIEQIQSGKVNPTPAERLRGADLGLYSITLNNNIHFDYATLEAYKEFRIEAELKSFRHFLEVFDPNACAGACPKDVGRFIADAVARTLAGVPAAGRPIFLKIPYHGPAVMEALVAYDPQLIPGILGGSSGTTHDAFRLLYDARRHGARAALFGRKINHSEHQLTFVRYLRLLADGQIEPAEAVKAYHGELEKLKLKPIRALKDDLELGATASAYAGSATKPKPAPAPAPAAPAAKPKPIVTVSGAGAPAPPGQPRPKVTFGRGGGGTTTPARPSAPRPTTTKGGNSAPKPSAGATDFKSMTPAQKVAYNLQRIKQDLARNNSTT